jgi:hypothetical protein
MIQAADSLLDHSTGPILPSQYNDLVRRRSPGFEGERRLLWAVLQNAIDIYRANMRCATGKQRDEFEEVCGWFRSPEDQRGRLFSFETICDLLEIDARLLLKGLESIRKREISANMRPSHAPRVAVGPARLAA